MFKTAAMFLVALSIFASALFTAGCAGKEASTANEKEMTLGLVQKNITKGMSQADVAEAIGSPNIVTKDSDGNETWVYDKIASEASYSSRGMYWTLILIGGSGGSGRSTTTQKTLTVVIRYDSHGKVEKVSYHASKF